MREQDPQSHLLPAQFAQLSACPPKVGVRGVLCVLLPNGREVSIRVLRSRQDAALASGCCARVRARDRVLRSRRAFQVLLAGGSGWGTHTQADSHLYIFRVIAVVPELVLEVHVGVTVQEEYNQGL